MLSQAAVLTGTSGPAGIDCKASALTSPASANCSAGIGFAAFSSRLLGPEAASRKVCRRCSPHWTPASPASEGPGFYFKGSLQRPTEHCHSLSGPIQYCPLPSVLIVGFQLHFSLSAFCSLQLSPPDERLHLSPSSPFPASISVVYILICCTRLISPICGSCSVLSLDRACLAISP